MLKWQGFISHGKLHTIVVIIYHVKPQMNELTTTSGFFFWLHVSKYLFELKWSYNSCNSALFYLMLVAGVLCFEASMYWAGWQFIEVLLFCCSTSRTLTLVSFSIVFNWFNIFYVNLCSKLVSVSKYLICMPVVDLLFLTYSLSPFLF